MLISIITTIFVHIKSFDNDYVNSHKIAIVITKVIILKC